MKKSSRFFSFFVTSFQSSIVLILNTDSFITPVHKTFNITDTLYFAPPIKMYTCSIKNAILWIYVRNEKESTQNYTHLLIEKIMPESIGEKKLIVRTVLTHRIRKNSGWLRVKVNTLLQRWLHRPMTNVGLRIRALGEKGDNLVVLPPASDIDRGYEPWLDTKVIEPKSNSRHRRSQSLFCTESSNERRCCRYPLQVRFSDFGWNWIVAPDEARVDYCHGECGMTMQNYSPASWIQQLVAREPCCSPTKMTALPLLYFDDNFNVILQTLQNIRVEECGCQ